MIEIKFMAWDKKLKRLISNEEFTFSPYFIQADGKVIVCDPGNEEHNFEELKDYVLMQYTGVEDNNNKELYFDYVVDKYYGNKFSSREAIENLDDLVRLYCEILENGMNFEIIGNKHENPKLLKEAKVG